MTTVPDRSGDAHASGIRVVPVSGCGPEALDEFGPEPAGGISGEAQRRPSAVPVSVGPGTAPPAPGRRRRARLAGAVAVAAAAALAAIGVLSAGAPPGFPAVRTPPVIRLSVSASDATHGVGGAWTMTSRIESSDVPRFEGLRLGYRVWFDQTGSRIEGHGFKWTENERPIPPSARTPISFEGTLAGGRWNLTFMEGGIRRTTRGRLALESSGRALHGRFSSEAARSRGRVVLTRAS